MNLQEMERLIGEAVRDADLRPEEIPAIDLYLDQITSLAAEKRREGSVHYRDRELTKTMINNYSKDGLISPIKGKKYSWNWGSAPHTWHCAMVSSINTTVTAARRR